jgi:hypothetical protein
MKRSPLPRKTPMKRGGRIRSRRKKPRDWKDAEVLSRFAETVTRDELSEHLCGPVWEQVRDGWNLHNELHTHHIFHAGKRVDCWWNLVRCSAPAHYYCHKEPVGGVVACMWAVLEREIREATLVEQIDGDIIHFQYVIRDQWRSAFGKDAVGWLQAKRDAGEIPSYYLETAEAVLGCF